jgi:integrase
MPLRAQKRGKYYHIIGTVAGQRIRESTGTADKAVAEETAAKREWEILRAAVYGTASTITFGQAVALYLEAKKDDRFILPIFDEWENKRLVDITGGDVTALATRLYPKASGATKNRQVVNVVRAIVNLAAKSGHCQKLAVEPFKTKKTVRRAVDRDWLDALRPHVPDRLWAVMLFNFSTGARISEATKLLWDDVDLFRKCALIRDPKNGEDREAHLTHEMMMVLVALPRVNRKVFGYATKQSVYGTLKRGCKAAGIPYLGTHQPGRHSFATEMIVRNGVDLATTAEAGGWKSRRLLAETYTHGERHKEAVDRVFGTKMTHENHKALDNKAK